MNLNIAPSPFEDEDQDHNPPRFSCQLFFDSTDRDGTKFYNHHQFYPEDDCYSYHGGSPYDDDTDDKGLKLTLWSDPVVKWKPSRVEPKTNVKEDHHHGLALQITTGGRNKLPHEDHQKLRPSSSLETDFSSNNNIIANNTNPTIRVCSDCNTTKTPLWRSGPKGPKSLCNACGIRQRKARRAMAAAAAATGMVAEVDRRPPVLKIKVQQQNKQKMRHGQDSKFKKRSKISSNATADGSSSSSSVPKKLDFEDFLIKLGKNSSFQRVFPQDEKDAAILLMALSSGLIHG